MNVPSYLYGGFISDTTTMSEHRRRAPDVKNSALPSLCRTESEWPTP